VDPLVGTVIDGRYRILRSLGSGGMGAVYEAEQIRLSRRVAIKTIHPHLATKPAVVERFRREATAAANTGSRHVVDVHDLGVMPSGAPFLVMEYLEGDDLAAMIAARGPLPPEAVVRVVAQACDALEAAHQAGIVHRDVKSENLMVLEVRGDPWFTKVVDFGISKLRDSSLTGSAELLGTPYAMAPEQLRASHEVDARADVYGLGVVLYHALAGTVPYDAETLPKLIAQITTEAPVPLRQRRPGLPDALYAIVDTAMARDPGSRFQSCAALQRALESLRFETSDAFAPTAPVSLASGASLPSSSVVSSPDATEANRTIHLEVVEPLPPHERASPTPPPPLPERERRAAKRAPSMLTEDEPPSLPTASYAPWIVLALLLAAGGGYAAFRSEIHAAFEAPREARDAGAAEVQDAGPRDAGVDAGSDAGSSRVVCFTASDRPGVVPLAGGARLRLGEQRIWMDLGVRRLRAVADDGTVVDDHVNVEPGDRAGCKVEVHFERGGVFYRTLRQPPSFDALKRSERAALARCRAIGGVDVTVSRGTDGDLIVEPQEAPGSECAAAILREHLEPGVLDRRAVFAFRLPPLEE